MPQIGPRTNSFITGRYRDASSIADLGDPFLPIEGGFGFTLDAEIVSDNPQVTLDAVLERTASASFTFNAVTKRTQAASFTLDAYLRGAFSLNAFLVFRPTFTLDACILGEIPVRPQQMSLQVGAVDVMDDIIYHSVRLGSQVNGQAGPAELWVRDLNHVYEFHAGDSLTFDIDGLRVWGGFITKAQPAFAFKADDTSDPELTERIWKLEGVDYNILFQKRFVFNRATPNKPLPTYEIGTRDDTMILDVVNRFLDLSNDSITTNNVEHVAIVNLDKRFNVANPGNTWGAAMTLITRPLGSIFYIDPDADLNHADVDVANAPFALSDRPSAIPMAVGYRDMELTKSASNMINDALVWGAGTGSVNGLVTFAREQDGTSINEHGLWQAGEFTTLMYTQASVNRRASTIVNGSPQSLRGAKDDQISIICTTFTPGFRAGQKVRFVSDVFDFEDVIPIRRMMITFPTPRNPQFELFLSHAIDAPWQTYEFWFPDFNFDLDFGDIDIDIDDIPTGLPGGDAECVPDVFDDFENRTISRNPSGTGGSWGTASSGSPWDTILDGFIYVEDGTGVLEVLGDNDTVSVGQFPAPTLTAQKNLRFKVMWNRLPDFDGGDDESGEIRFRWRDIDGTIVVNLLFSVDINPDNSSFSLLQLGGGPGSGSDFIQPFDWDADVWYIVAYQQNGFGARAKVWLESDPEPENWMIETTRSINVPLNERLDVQIDGRMDVLPWINYFDDILTTNCPAPVTTEIVIDDFGRTNGSAWGVATSGFEWSGAEPFGDPNITWSVTGGEGHHFVESTTTWSNTSVLEIPHDITEYLNEAQDLTFRFRFSNVGNGTTTSRVIELQKEGWDFGTMVQVVFNDLAVGAQRGRIRIGTTSFVEELDKIDWIANTWYTVKWRIGFSGSELRLRAKIWHDSESEPDWMLTHTDSYSTSPMDPDFTDTIQVSYTLSHNPSITRSMDFDDILLFIGVSPSTSGTPVGYGCFSFEGDGMSNVFTIPREYQPGSAQVYIDGLFQTISIHYTESDPPGGEVTFNNAPPDGSTVTICSSDPTAPGAGGRPPPLL